MSEQLTPAQTNFVWEQFRAGGHNGLSDAQVEALFDTIDRLRAERRVTKGLHTKIDAQAATIQRIRDLHAPEFYEDPDDERFCQSCQRFDDDATYPCPTVRALDGARNE